MSACSACGSERCRPLPPAWPPRQREMDKEEALFWIRECLWKAVTRYSQRYGDTPDDNYRFANGLALRFWGRPLRTKLRGPLDGPPADPVKTRADIERTRQLPAHDCNGYAACQVPGCNGLWFAYAMVAYPNGTGASPRPQPVHGDDVVYDRPGRGGRPVARRSRRRVGAL